MFRVVVRGTLPTAHRYVSMNFMAFEYWTDGWRDGSLMRNDKGRRQSQCGRFVLTKDLGELETADTSNVPRIGHVPSELQPECKGSGLGRCPN